MSRTFRYAPNWVLTLYEKRHDDQFRGRFWERAVAECHGRRPVLRDGFLNMSQTPHGWCRVCGSIPHEEQVYDNRQRRHRLREEIRKGRFDDL